MRTMDAIRPVACGVGDHPEPVHLGRIRRGAADDIDDAAAVRVDRVVLEDHVSRSGVYLHEPGGSAEARVHPVKTLCTKLMLAVCLVGRAVVTEQIHARGDVSDEVVLESHVLDDTPGAAPFELRGVSTIAKPG